MILPLAAAMGDPGPFVIKKGLTVMYGYKMAVRICCLKGSSKLLPVVCGEVAQKFIFVCQRPPYITESAVPGGDITQVQQILFHGHG